MDMLLSENYSENPGYVTQQRIIFIGEWYGPKSLEKHSKTIAI